jgi:hypothetical protein
LASLYVIRGGSSCPGIGVTKLLLIMLVGTYHRFKFHYKPGHEVEDNHRPESADQEQNNEDDPNPEDGKIEVISNAPANPHYHPASGSIKPSVITHIVESSHDVSPLLF